MSFRRTRDKAGRCHDRNSAQTFYDAFTTAAVQGRTYRIFPRQLIVWVSIGHKGMRDLDTRVPRFPAVLDPGFTDNFLIHTEQLRQFAGLHPEHLRRLNESLRAHGREIPLHAANLWIHRNQSGKRDEFTQAAPFLVELHRGIGVVDGADAYPRLPLLGARSLRGAGLQVLIDYKKCLVHMRQPRKFWPFG